MFSHLPSNSAPDDESYETLLSGSMESEREPRISKSWCRRRIFSHGILLLVASIFFALWMRSLKIERSCPVDPLLTYSPINEALEYVNGVQFNGSLDATSIYRGEPSPELDALWRSVSTGVKVTRLSDAELLEAGYMDTPALIKFQPEDGGGYMANVDGYHQIHCVDLVRKILRRDYYESFDLSFNPSLRPHLDHCIDLLRQKLMCTADLTMVTYDWVHGFADPQPNFSTVHQCVNFDKLLGWSKEHNAHVLKSHVVRFGNVTDLLEPPQW
ncbi:hypothetical protein HYDPIDRAFT_27029 [Hydnomerulius pinastri MD-312]|nr:hypothetical protein HYDPIDRAFT_27029 [Hydnomerulius pinastri MD-312]